MPGACRRAPACLDGRHRRDMRALAVVLRYIAELAGSASADFDRAAVAVGSAFVGFGFGAVGSETAADSADDSVGPASEHSGTAAWDCDALRRAGRAPRQQLSRGTGLPRPSPPDAFFPRWKSSSRVFLPASGRNVNTSISVLAARERFHLIQHLRITIQRLQVVYHSSILAGRLRRLHPICHTQIGTTAHKQH